jgi:hypothetical protein
LWRDDHLFRRVWKGNGKQPVYVVRGHLQEVRVDRPTCYAADVKLAAKPAHKFLGRGHRVLFHDFPSACLIAQKCYPGDPNAIYAACEHIFLDEQCSANPEFKKQLEELAIQSSKNRRRKQTKTQMPVEDPTLRDLKKLVDIERLVKLLRSQG